ncbi:MAG TPA: hypothetical protein VMA34_00780 [Terracidiphilus sp.]|nr:hypothetical protein [Terracidiphilus sp.]
MLYLMIVVIVVLSFDLGMNIAGLARIYGHGDPSLVRRPPEFSALTMAAAILAIGFAIHVLIQGLFNATKPEPDEELPKPRFH